MVDGDSPLLTFLDSPKPKEEESVAPTRHIGDNISDSDGHSSLSDSASSVVHQGKSVTERESLPTITPPETPSVVASGTILPTEGRRQFLRLARLGADGNLTLLQLVDAFKSNREILHKQK